jgi:hypothetical protein
LVEMEIHENGTWSASPWQAPTLSTCSWPRSWRSGYNERFFFLKQGWPDWANFCLLGDRSLLAVFGKLQK